MKRILVIRLSAFGDVAILEPVLRARAAANPDVQFLLAAPERMTSLFSGIPNLQFVPTQKKQSSRQLYHQLARLKPTMVADMHHVNRVIGADWFFRLHGIRVHSIRKHDKPIRPSWKRYDEVFDHCGLTPAEYPSDYWSPKTSKNGMRVIGIAPFAQHKGKIWPLERMEQLVERLSAVSQYQVCLFGSREEAATLDSWASRYPRVESLAGKYSFADELKIISDLDVMVSMDSSNMHFASCLGVPVVSVWGATHPRSGFYGWRQSPDWAVQSNLTCRPCSRYGNKPCKLGDYPCLKTIDVDTVYQKILEVLG